VLRTSPDPGAAGADPGDGEISRWIAAARQGDAEASERLFRAVYSDLRRIARHHLGLGSPGATVSTSVLVHETYLRLARPGNLDLNDRTHFFSVASRAMRQILVDHARRRAAEKRGGGAFALELDEERHGAPDRTVELLALDRALAKLERFDPRLAKVVEWRFFAGLTLEQIADSLGLAERTVKRDWRKARAFLYREIGGDATLGSPP
jgi:RNA polymerase sigma factor (TIGR02999 family)